MSSMNSSDLDSFKAYKHQLHTEVVMKVGVKFHESE